MLHLYRQWSSGLAFLRANIYSFTHFRYSSESLQHCLITALWEPMWTLPATYLGRVESNFKGSMGILLV